MHAGNLPCHEFAADRPAPFWTDAYAQGYRNSGWYFWDETEAYVQGPYPTFEEGERARAAYQP